MLYFLVGFFVQPLEMNRERKENKKRKLIKIKTYLKYCSMNACIKNADKNITLIPLLSAEMIKYYNISTLSE